MKYSTNVQLRYNELIITKREQRETFVALRDIALTQLETLTTQSEKNEIAECAWDYLARREQIATIEAIIADMKKEADQVFGAFTLAQYWDMVSAIGARSRSSRSTDQVVIDMNFDRRHPDVLLLDDWLKAAENHVRAVLQTAKQNQLFDLACEAYHQTQLLDLIDACARLDVEVSHG